MFRRDHVLHDLWGWLYVDIGLATWIDTDQAGKRHFSKGSRACKIMEERPELELRMGGVVCLTWRAGVIPDEVEMLLRANVWDEFLLSLQGMW